MPDVGAGSAVERALVQLDRAQAHHGERVLRLERGESVELFDGHGHVGTGRWGPKGAIELVRTAFVPPPIPAVDAAVAMPKGGRADALVGSLSQLGADRLIPLRTDRSVVHPRPGRLERLSAAVIESARQCGRAHLMAIDPPSGLEAVLGLGHDLSLFARCDCEPAAPPVADRAPGPGPLVLAQRLGGCRRLLILVGPEGGWTAREERLAAEHGCLAWTLGPHVLRIETAALAAVAIARFLTLEGRRAPRP
jgi:16S rRNA (uracil1498-N3)-methyltransferase